VAGAAALPPPCRRPAAACRAGLPGPGAAADLPTPSRPAPAQR